MIASTLQRMLSPQTAHRELHLNVLNDLCQSIQLLPNTHPKRLIFLVSVGDIYMESHQYQSEDALNKAVYIYEDTMLNVPWEDTQTYMYARYGVALQLRLSKRALLMTSRNLSWC